MPLYRWLFAALGGLFCASPAFAHRMLLTCTAEGDRVRVEVFFDDDTPAQEATVSVADLNQKPIAEGKTDERGVWTFAKPAPGAYTVKASGIGHSATQALIIAGDAAVEAPTTVPPREELTRTPWLNVGIGLGVIAGLCVLGLLCRKSRNGRRMDHGGEPPPE
jgi:nickel transport protein